MAILHADEVWPIRGSCTQFLSVRCCPAFRSRAHNIGHLVATLQTEITAFKHPFAIGSDKCQFRSRKRECHRLCLSGRKVYLSESAQTASVGYDGRHSVAAEQQHAFLAGTRTGIGHVHAYGKRIFRRELRLVYAKITIGERRIALPVAKSPLHGHNGIIIVITFHFLSTAVLIFSTSSLTL